MKTTELVNALAPLSRMTVYRHLRALKIKPLGIRQRPQQWPEDSLDKIQARLGIKTTVATEKAAKLPTGAQLRELKRRVKR